MGSVLAPRTNNPTEGDGMTVQTPAVGPGAARQREAVPVGASVPSWKGMGLGIS